VRLQRGTGPSVKFSFVRSHSATFRNLRVNRGRSSFGLGSLVSLDRRQGMNNSSSVARSIYLWDNVSSVKDRKPCEFRSVTSSCYGAEFPRGYSSVLVVTLLSKALYAGSFFGTLRLIYFQQNTSPYISHDTDTMMTHYDTGGTKIP
jgi:hypothetical protein